MSGAAEYLVRHERSDACGSATHYQTVTGTASSSGAHPNCNSSTCYSKSCTVTALSSSGVVLAEGSASICATGCSSGNCCDNDGWCESEEGQLNCPGDCPCNNDGSCDDELGENSTNCSSDCSSGGGGVICHQGKSCSDSAVCGPGFCASGKCQCF